ncbi:RagB/SusD family nutrient uptake outer membrane protein [Rapidithrix thailandica]|uniref:RagB/SusD family nutrient uptake outer membrane protein n=1 Tax=Rapidithrix thailandica TaxID=413964 RepID=A0AAW9RXX0_9BACT
MLVIKYTFKNLWLAGMASLCILLTSCDPDLLDTQPENKYVESNFWKSKEAAYAALTACYAPLGYSGVYGGDATPLWEETATPNSYNETNSMSFNALASGQHSASTGGVISSRWNHCYSGIGRCNTLLARIDEVEMDEEEKVRMKGEAHFLRALYYFILRTYYGDAPLVLDPPVREHSDLPRTPASEVIQQVLTDLETASDVLPWSYGSSDLGRVTKGAAMALKARVLFYEASPLFNPQNDMNRWKTAMEAAKAVMDVADEAGYDLYPDYRALFLPENEHNEEVIFDVQFIYPDGGNSFDLICRQYNTNAPLLDLANAYLMEDGLPSDLSPLFDAANPYENRDPRFYATVVFPGDTFMGEEVSETRFAITGFGQKKYSIYDEEAAPADKADLKSKQSETNYIVLRYADILMMYAEAKNEFSGPDAEVYAALNALRTRVGMPVLNSGHSQQEMREVIRHERRIEFAGEGLYYNDIRRWMIAEQVLDGPIYTWDKKQLEIRKFDKNRDYWWPVPQAELDLTDMEQNTGY